MRQKRELPHIYLKQGEFHCTSEPAMISTVLGSCIAITMYSRKHGTGAMCHVLLPRCRNKGVCGLNCTENFKYLECTFPYMLEKFDRLKMKRAEIDVKIFGGADMFERKRKTTDLMSVGRQNVELALSLMKKEGLKPKAKDVGGEQGRKIFFFTNTGEVFLKRLPRKDGTGR